MPNQSIQFMRNSRNRARMKAKREARAFKRALRRERGRRIRWDREHANQPRFTANRLAITCGAHA